jgi:hypothetical protein
VTLLTLAAIRFVRGARYSGGLSIASKTVAVKTNSATEADARSRGREFRRRVWLQGYEDNSDRKGGCDTEALQMIESWIDINFAGPKTNNIDLAQWCDKLAATPSCSDPLLLTVTAPNAIE